MATTLSDIIVPELFNPYVIQRSMELSALYQSGIVSNNAEFDRLASEPAPIHHMPFFEDLTGDAEIVIEGNKLTPAKITSNQDVSTTIRLAKAWAATDLSAQLSGKDPMEAIATLVAKYWERQRQKVLLRILKGVFSSEKMKAEHVYDVSSKAGKLANISASAFIDALQLLGDAQDQLTGVIMHSKTKSYLKQQNLISTERDSNSVEFETYQDRRVIVDDGCPLDGDVYTTYLFGQGAIALGNGSPEGFVATETDREKLMGSGIDYLINRQCFIMHPRGIKWTNTARANVETPTFKELENPTNWERVYDKKQIRMVAFKHKVG
ncbi:coat protein [Megamonas funiformis]|uniref:Coat protein n=1 Tax=Megamonas funiformis YIT 11815 TaxID=742816 RepID=A0ABP2NMI4_9FIRM|nr:major capsid protein [Megamonas funiformis]EHR38840.1 hypothetical protein HMPREF9454_00438 [Megamonas funiformis YIT 11815]QIB60226.1 coat protein [Megamonas funiformis]